MKDIIKSVENPLALFNLSYSFDSPITLFPRYPILGPLSLSPTFIPTLVVCLCVVFLTSDKKEKRGTTQKKKNKKK